MENYIFSQMKKVDEKCTAVYAGRCFYFKSGCFEIERIIKWT